MEKIEDNISQLKPEYLEQEIDNLVKEFGVEEENTIFGSYQKEIKKYQEKISNQEQFSLSTVHPAVLFYNQGELFENYLVMNQADPVVKKNLIREYADIFLRQNNRYPISELNPLALLSPEEVKEFSRENPIDALEIFERTNDESLLANFDQESIKTVFRADVNYALNLFDYTNSEVLLKFFDKKMVRKYFKEQITHAFGVLANTNSQSFLALLDQEFIKKVLRSNAEHAIDLFTLTKSELFFTLLDQEAIKEYSQQEQLHALIVFSHTNSEALFKFFDKKAIADYCREYPGQALEIFADTKSQSLFELFDREIIKNYLIKIKDSSLLALLPQSLFTELGIENRQKTVFAGYKKKAIEFDLAQIKNAFTNEEPQISFSDDELKDLSSSLNDLYDIYYQTIQAEKTNSQPSTFGTEIELLNDQHWELRIPLVDFDHLAPLQKVFKWLSLFIYQKFDKFGKQYPDKFQGYPHSNLHLNFSLTEEQLAIAEKFKQELETICYADNLAYSPVSRIDFLEKSQNIKNSTNREAVEKINPNIVARYQDRYLSVGGSKNEITSSLAGLTTVVLQLKNCLNNPAAIKDLHKYLATNHDFQNRAWELKWIISQIKDGDQQRKEIEERINNEEKLKKSYNKIPQTDELFEAIDLCKKYITEQQAELQKNQIQHNSWRNYFFKTQKLMQISLEAWQGVTGKKEVENS